MFLDRGKKQTPRADRVLFLDARHVFRQIGRAHEGLPRAYTPDVYQAKCTVRFEHVFESFGDTNRA